MSTAGPELRELFPAACVASRPVRVAVGHTFETVTVSERQGRTLVELMDHLAIHPVGAVTADQERWRMIVPRGSGEPCWPAGAEHRADGYLWVPPLSTQVPGQLQSARYGNGEGRPFTAPLVVHPLLPVTTVGGAAGGCRHVRSKLSADGQDLDKAVHAVRDGAGPVAVIAVHSDDRRVGLGPLIADGKRTGFDLRHALLHMRERMGPGQALRHSPFFGGRLNVSRIPGVQRGRE